MKDEKSKLKKYKYQLRALVNPKISFKSKGKILIENSVFIFLVLITLLSGVIGELSNNNN